MAFSDYKTIAQVQQQYNIIYQEINFIPHETLTVSPHFMEELEFNRVNLDVFTSEAARTETIIFPVLREVYKGYYQRYSLWIQKAISYDDMLNGTPDYMIATRSALGKTVLEMPLVMIVEAKKNDFEQGWAQCLAELVAAQKLNGEANRPVYGVVTDGKLWEFGKLIADKFSRNIDGYTVDDLPHLFGALSFIFNESLQQN